jgi:hypothetical protein
MSKKSAIGPYPVPDESSPHLFHPAPLMSNFISFRIHLAIPSGLFPLGFPTKILYAFVISPMRATCLSHIIIFDHHNNVWRSVKITKFVIRQSSQASRHFLLGPNIPLSTLFSDTPNLCSPLDVRDQVSHPYKTTDEIRMGVLSITQSNSVGPVRNCPHYTSE